MLLRENFVPLCGHCKFSWFTPKRREVTGGIRGHVLCSVCGIFDVHAACPCETPAGSGKAECDSGCLCPPAPGRWEC